MKMGKNSNAAGHIEPDRVICLFGGFRLFAERDIFCNLGFTFPGKEIKRIVHCTSPLLHFKMCYRSLK